jgi:alginate O-acetyltransferase complex protein AlgI
MLYSELIFWQVFLPALSVYWFLSHRFQNITLLLGSYLFYASWEPIFVGILFISSLTDFLAGIYASPSRKFFARKIVFATSLTVNFGALFTFKYFNFFSSSLIHSLGIESDLIHDLIRLGLPVGMSFYTFQSVSYTFDCYRGKIAPTRSLPDFLIYVSYFPQLLAGPIERAKKLISQISSPRQFHPQLLIDGAYLVLLGLFKKIYISNYLSQRLTDINGADDFQGPFMVAGGIVTTFIVYADFSGYCDLARGISKMLGIELVINFRPFYFSRNPADFWNRWNITLGTWVRDYLILPFRNKSRGEFFHAGLILTAMLLVGIWHAPKWSWVVFGLMHGIALLSHRHASRIRIYSPLSALLKPIGITLMFVLYAASGLLHYLGDVSYDWTIIEQLTTGWSLTPDAARFMLASFFIYLPLFIFEIFQERIKNYDFIGKSAIEARLVFVVVAVLGIAAGSGFESKAFIYYKF